MFKFTFWWAVTGVRWDLWSRWFVRWMRRDEWFQITSISESCWTWVRKILSIWDQWTCCKAKAMVTKNFSPSIMSYLPFVRGSSVHLLSITWWNSCLLCTGKVLSMFLIEMRLKSFARRWCDTSTDTCNFGVIVIKRAFVRRRPWMALSVRIPTAWDDAL